MTGRTGAPARHYGSGASRTRMQGLAGMLKKLEAADVRIGPKRQDEDYGRLAWVV